MNPPTGRQLEITLLQERSAGTFAKVYLAEARGTDNLSRIVAVKVLKEQWSESSEILDRTYDEARLLARLHHKNILRVEALTELEGQPAIIMEFVDGVDLKQLIERLARRGERIPPRAAYKIAQDAAGALEASYFKVPYGRSEPLQVVHRDVKPSNIMLSVEGEVKVLDFGTARSNYEGRLARTGALRFGSLKYMSPERREGDRGDHTTDVYALGLVLLEMLRGESLPLLPLDANEHDEAVADILANLGPLGLPNEQWDDSLRQTIAAMCASQPTHRLNASQVVQLLRAFAEQAGGPSLDSFAANTVAPITKELYGVEHQGPLTGTRLLVSISTTNDGIDGPRGRGASLMPEPQTGAPRPGASLVPGAERVDEAYRAPQPVEESYDDEAMPTVMQGGAAVAEMRAAAAEIAERGQAPQDNGGYGGYSDAAYGQPYAEAQQPYDAGDEDEAPAPNRKRTLVLLAVAAMVGLFLVLAVAGVGVGLWWYSQRDGGELAQTGEPTPATADPSSSNVSTPNNPPTASGATYTVSVSGDDLFQWIKLSDASGQQVFKGTPSGKGEVPAGAYTLAAKQAGREALKATVQVDGDLDLTCTVNDQKQVSCAGGAAPIVLSP